MQSYKEDPRSRLVRGMHFLQGRLNPRTWLTCPVLEYGDQARLSENFMILFKLWKEGTMNTCKVYSLLQVLLVVAESVQDIALVSLVAYYSSSSGEYIRTPRTRPGSRQILVMFYLSIFLSLAKSKTSRATTFITCKQC